MNKLVLFDIENTLLNTSSGHRKAMSDSFKTIFGVDWDIDKNINIIRVDGMTDQIIVYRILTHLGLKRAAIKNKIKDYMKAVVANYQKTVMEDNMYILNGVEELLKELQKRGILMGLVTGNLEPLAKMKLRRVGLNHYFQFGGFGSDPHTTRGDLVKLAIKKAEREFGFKSDGKNVFLFGDAIADMEAGKEANITAVGITTGTFTKEDLLKAGADYTIDNLADTNKILQLIVKKES